MGNFVTFSHLYYMVRISTHIYIGCDYLVDKLLDGSIVGVCRLERQTND